LTEENSQSAVKMLQNIILPKRVGPVASRCRAELLCVASYHCIGMHPNLLHTAYTEYSYK